MGLVWPAGGPGARRWRSVGACDAPAELCWLPPAAVAPNESVALLGSCEQSHSANELWAAWQTIKAQTRTAYEACSAATSLAPRPAPPPPRRAMRRLLVMLLLMTANAQTDAPTPVPRAPTPEPTDPTPRPTPSPSPRPRNWTPSPTRSPKPTMPPTLSFSPTFAPSPAPSVEPSAAPSPFPTPQPQTAAPTQKPIPEKFPFYFTVAGVEVMKTQITFLNSLCACVFVGGTLRHLYDSLWRPKMSLVEGRLRSNRRF